MNRFFAVMFVLLAGSAHAQETFRLGVVSFLSGPAAESFGVPAVNGAKVVIDAFNKGAAPAPYNKVGFGGVKIEPIYVDENGGGPIVTRRDSCLALFDGLLYNRREIEQRLDVKNTSIAPHHQSRRSHRSRRWIAVGTPS